MCRVSALCRRAGKGLSVLRGGGVGLASKARDSCKMAVFRPITQGLRRSAGEISQFISIFLGAARSISDLWSGPGLAGLVCLVAGGRGECLCRGESSPNVLAFVLLV